MPLMWGIPNNKPDDIAVTYEAYKVKGGNQTINTQHPEHIRAVKVVCTGVQGGGSHVKDGLTVK